MSKFLVCIQYYSILSSSGGDVCPQPNGCYHTEALVGGVVGGFVGGVLLTAILGAIIYVVVLQRMKLAHITI